MITPHTPTLTGEVAALAARVRSLELRDTAELIARLEALEARVTALEA